VHESVAHNHGQAEWTPILFPQRVDHAIADMIVIGRR
jgi:hypothetical protein